MSIKSITLGAAVLAASSALALMGCGSQAPSAKVPTPEPVAAPLAPAVAPVEEVRSVVAFVSHGGLDTLDKVSADLRAINPLSSVGCTTLATDAEALGEVEARWLPANIAAPAVEAAHYDQRAGNACAVGDWATFTSALNAGTVAQDQATAEINAGGTS